MNADDYLQLSGIQHFAFCRRQWALIHIEQIWSENERTISGTLMHERAHDPYQTEKRKDLIVTREMPVRSHTMEITGKCDIVEFRKDDGGVALSRHRGLWLPCPVEYKRGSPKTTDADRLQLCAQAMCLEEMLVCPEIEVAYLYYGETKHREEVTLTTELREKVRSMFAEMRSCFERRYTPRVKQSKSCNACSLKNECLPKLPNERSVAAYISGNLEE